VLILTLFAMAPVGVTNATVAKPADGSFKRYDEAKIQPSSNRPVNSISKGWGCEPSAGFSASITRRSLAGWYKPPKHSQPAHHRPKPAPSSKSMNSARSSLKKSQCGLWLAVDSIFGKVLGFACGRRTIKTGKVLFVSRSSTCRRKTLCYSKSKTMWEVSLKLHIHKLKKPLSSNAKSLHEKPARLVGT